MKLKPAESAAENARAVLPKMARKYFEAGRKAIEGKRPPDELHGFRLETKRFRYTLELFRPLYGPNLDRYLKALRELQGALGKVSDYQAIQRVLSNDRELNKQIEHLLKGKVRDLRQSWRAFDADGKLKRWRVYLAGEHSKPRTKRPAVRPAAKKAAARPKK
jgi:CHAD domain-containing protein